MAGVSSDTQPNGLGGWLLLPIFHLFLAIVITLINLAQIVSPDSLEGIKVIFADNSEVSGLRIPIIVSTVIAVFYLTYTANALVNIFKKTSITPKLMIGFYIFGFVLTAVEIYLAKWIVQYTNEPLQQEMFKELIQVIVACAIWIPYFLVSKRVKNTFSPRDEQISEIFA